MAATVEGEWPALRGIKLFLLVRSAFVYIRSFTTAT